MIYKSSPDYFVLSRILPIFAVECSTHKKNKIMKKTVFIAVISALCFSSCSKDDEPQKVNLEIAIAPPDNSDHAIINFRCTGDFELTPFSRTRSLEADGKAMTDLWVLDYIVPIGSIGTIKTMTLAQTIHQTTADADFGSPTLDLAAGDHHLYFIASRGKTPTLDTEAHTLTFATVSDTFYSDYSITIVPTSNGSRSVTLNRCVTRLRLTITDALPDGITSINVTPASWYYGIDYTTGEPITATASQTITTNVPDGYAGQTNVSVNIFGFSPSAEWITDVAINAKSADNTTLGSVAITDAPLMRNRTTEYTGPLFSSSGATTVSLSTEWLDTHNSTW